jgi:hypothetical protein
MELIDLVMWVGWIPFVVMLSSALKVNTKIDPKATH